MLTDCCGGHFCKDCIEPVRDTQKPCPECNQPNFSLMINKYMKKKVLELDVLCPLKGRGCHWKGEVRSRKDHLNPKNENSCQFLDVECTYGCGEDMEKYELPEHLNQFCRRRPYKCGHCGLDGVYMKLLLMITTQYAPSIHFIVRMSVDKKLFSELIMINIWLSVLSKRFSVSSII